MYPFPIIAFHLSWPKLDYEAHKEYKKLLKHKMVLEKKKLEDEGMDKALFN
jgi:hypothetical protein